MKGLRGLLLRLLLRECSQVHSGARGISQQPTMAAPLEARCSRVQPAQGVRFPLALPTCHPERRREAPKSKDRLAEMRGVFIFDCATVAKRLQWITAYGVEQAPLSQGQCGAYRPTICVCWRGVRRSESNSLSATVHSWPGIAPRFRSFDKCRASLWLPPKDACHWSSTIFASAPLRLAAARSPSGVIAIW